MEDDGAVGHAAGRRGQRDVGEQVLPGFIQGVFALDESDAALRAPFKRDPHDVAGERFAIVQRGAAVEEEAERERLGRVDHFDFDHGVETLETLLGDGERAGDQQQADDQDSQEGFFHDAQKAASVCKVESGL